MYANFDKKQAYLSSDFGKEFAERIFGKEFVDSLPKFVKGKRKGKTKGEILWTRCIKGGWVKTARERGEGFVETQKGKIVAIVIDIQGWGDFEPKYVACKVNGFYYGITNHEQVVMEKKLTNC